MQRSLTRISTFRNRKVHRQNCLQQLRVFDLSDIIIYLLVSCTVLCCAVRAAMPNLLLRQVYLRMRTLGLISTNVYNHCLLLNMYLVLRVGNL